MATHSPLPIHVRMLSDYEYTIPFQSAVVSVQAGERFCLIRKITANWWLVARLDPSGSQLVVPACCAEEIQLPSPPGRVVSDGEFRSLDSTLSHGVDAECVPSKPPDKLKSKKSNDSARQPIFDEAVMTELFEILTSGVVDDKNVLPSGNLDKNPVRSKVVGRRAMRNGGTEGVARKQRFPSGSGYKEDNKNATKSPANRPVSMVLERSAMRSNLGAGSGSRVGLGSGVRSGSHRGSSEAEFFASEEIGSLEGITSSRGKGSSLSTSSSPEKNADSSTDAVSMATLNSFGRKGSVTRGDPPVVVDSQREMVDSFAGKGSGESKSSHVAVVSPKVKNPPSTVVTAAHKNSSEEKDLRVARSSPGSKDPPKSLATGSAPVISPAGGGGMSSPAGGGGGSICSPGGTLGGAFGEFWRNDRSLFREETEEEGALGGSASSVDLGFGEDEQSSVSSGGDQLKQDEVEGPKKPTTAASLPNAARRRNPGAPSALLPPPAGATPLQNFPGSWEMHRDSPSDRNYYFNRETKETSWTLPRRRVAPLSDPSVTNSEPNEIPAGWKKERNPDGEAEFVHAGTGARFRRLPDDEGRVYFYNVETVTSFWFLPGEEEIRADAELYRQQMGKFSEKAGALRRAKVAENGKKLRKVWTPSYVVLCRAMLYFYREQKVAQTVKDGCFAFLNENDEFDASEVVNGDVAD